MQAGNGERGTIPGQDPIDLLVSRVGPTGYQTSDRQRVASPCRGAFKASIVANSSTDCTDSMNSIVQGLELVTGGEHLYTVGWARTDYFVGGCYK